MIELTGMASATRDAGEPAHAGFDRLTYPGDAVMTALYDNTNLAWTGFYLAPAPSQPYTGWMTKAQTLRDMGWGSPRSTWVSSGQVGLVRMSLPPSRAASTRRMR